MQVIINDFRQLFVKINEGAAMERGFPVSVVFFAPSFLQPVAAASPG